MAQAEFSYTGEAHPLPGGRTLVRGTRTSGGGRAKKHVFIEVECLPEEVGAVQNALAVLLQRHGRINATCFQDSAHEDMTMRFRSGRRWEIPISQALQIAQVEAERKVLTPH